MSKPQQFDSWPEDLQPGFGPYRMTAEKIVDGDTIYALADLGLRQYTYVSLRLKDVDAPEIYSGPDHVRAWGQEVKTALGLWLPKHTKTLVETFRDRRTFDRYEARIHLSRGYIVNQQINAWMQNQPWWPAYLEYKAES